MTKKNIINISEANEKLKEKIDTRIQKSFWKELNELQPYDIVREFIKEKGLKLYGGQAHHEHIVRTDKKGLYSKNEFPDYDVFSPNAWEHAKELSDRLHKLGLSFVEAKPSVLNDEHHQTYKVGVDMVPMLDLTQVGCEPLLIKNGNCQKCGVKSNGTCISVFNEIPALNITESSKKIYRKTYDYKTDQSIYNTKFFVTSPDWLKISMYREITEPLQNPARLPKVSSRLEKFNKLFETKFKDTCDEKNFTIPKNIQSILNYISEYNKKTTSIDFGLSAINFYLKNIKKDNIPEIHQSYYIITDVLAYKLFDLLKNVYKNEKFKISKRLLYWKQQFDTEFIIYVKNKNKYFKLVTFVEVEACVPYIKANNKNYATSDNIIFNLYYRKEMGKLFKKSEIIPYDVDCVLRDVLKSQKKFKKTRKFKRYISRCIGDEIDKRITSSQDRWEKKMKLVKKTKYYIDYPNKGLITKIQPLPEKKIKTPYRPEEISAKTYTYNKSKKKYNKNYLDAIKMI